MKRSKGRNVYVSHAVQEQVLDIIREHIGRPCPTNLYIMEMMGKDRAMVQRALALLCGRGILSRSGTYNSRSYMIVETGESTLPTKHKVIEQQTEYATRNVSFLSSGMGRDVLYRDMSPEELDERGRAYLEFDAMRGWPRHWPERPIACKATYISPALAARLSSIPAQAS